MKREIVALQSEVQQLNKELQHQKGMLWILGEIIKSSNNIGSFRELMKNLTDMLMGVMGVSSCYLWIFTDNKCTLHFRSIFLFNLYKEVEAECVPSFLQNIQGHKPFHDLDIRTPFIESTRLPGSRLAIPLYDFQHNTRLGVMVVEHESANFFTESTCLLFETLAIVIASNSRNSKLLETVSKEAEHDPLTKIYNRKYLTRFSNNFPYNSTPLSLCVFDIDCFKDINDIYGHAKGDEVLISIAQATQGILAPYNGKIIRYGGDEFVILLKQSLQESIHILDQIRITVPNLPIVKKLNYPVTITMGVSEYPTHANNIDELFSLADEALLSGKALGKDCLEITNIAPHTPH